MQIAHGIERDRLKEGNHALFFARQSHAFAQHPGRVSTIGRDRQNNAGNVAQDGNRVVIVEMPTKALLIAKPCDAQHHWVGELPFGKERQRCCFAANLIFGIVQIGEELDFGHWRKAILTHANRQPEDGLLIQKRVDHAILAKPLLQFLRDTIDAALKADIFAHHHNIRMGEHHIGHGPVDQARHDLRLFHRAHVRAEGLRACLLRWTIRQCAVPFGRYQRSHNIIRGF